MRRPLTITLGLLLCASGAIVACAEDDPEPGYTQTGGSAGSETSGGSAGAPGGGSGGSGGSGQGAGGSAGSGGSSSGGQGGGGAGGAGGQGAACAVDANEPNNTPVQARLAPGVDGDGIMSDCDDEDAINGLLDGSEDQDWFRYTGKDQFNCGISTLEPRVTLNGAGFDAEVCIFVKLIESDETPACADGGGTPSDELSDQGFSGCCAANEARASFGSFGGDDGADVFMRVSKLSSEALCGAYKITFAFN